MDRDRNFAGTTRDRYVGGVAPPAEMVEGALLDRQARARGLRGLLLERPVNALVTSVLLGLARGNVLVGPSGPPGPRPPRRTVGATCARSSD